MTEIKLQEIEKKNQEVSDSEFWNDLNNQELKRKSGGRAKLLTPEYMLMENLLNGVEIKHPKTNEIVQGIYTGMMASFHCFAVKGYKDWVRVDGRQLESKYLKNTQIGDKIDVLIIDIDDDNYFIQGSISSIYETRAHEALKALDENIVVKALVKSLSPAGYSVEIQHDGVTLPGFMPNTLAGINKLYDPTIILDKELEVMIESYSEDEGTYIVSRRKYLKTLIPASISELETHKVYEGHVTGTTPFGVFVEFNECLTGMIHKANIQEDWREKISEIRPGFTIQFYVKEIVKDKIILTQIIRETLWDTIRNGQLLDGKVKDTKPFGTLVFLDEETIGLIHTSEMEKNGKRYEPGDDVKVKVLALDRQNRKIFLTPVTN